MTGWGPALGRDRGPTPESRDLGALDVFVADAVGAEADVAADCAGEQERILQDYSVAAAQVG